MKIRDLVNEWQKNAAEKRTVRVYQIHLPLHIAASVRALAEMYPGRIESEIITDLLTAAIYELEESFPYKQGANIVGEDEFGNPVYEDIGPTPRFNKLTRQYLQVLGEESGEDRIA